MQIVIQLSLMNPERDLSRVKACQTSLANHLRRKYPDASVDVSLTETAEDDTISVSGGKTAWDNAQLERNIAANDFQVVWDSVQPELRIG